MLAAMRVLTDPAETGAVTVCFPQDVQAAGPRLAARAVRRARLARRPTAPRGVACCRGGRGDPLGAPPAGRRRGRGALLRAPTDALAVFCEATGVPVGQSQAGKGTLAFDHPQCLGAIGSTGTTAANAIARDADVVVGIGTRYSDFTTASRTAFQRAGVRFVNVNVAPLDAVKHSGVGVVADARETLEALRAELAGWRVDDGYVEEYRRLDAEWQATVDAAYHPAVPAAGVLTQSEVLGMVNDLTDPRDVVVCAAGSLPGDLHKLWQIRDPQGLPRRVRLLVHGLRDRRGRRRRDWRAPTATSSSWSATART